MRVILQRVNFASVEVNKKEVSFMEIVEKVIDLALMVVYPVLKLKGNMKNF